MEKMKDKEFYINCDGIEIHSKLEFPDQVSPCYPLLILIPGLTGHMEEEHILAAKDVALELGYAVLRVELYGHGKSGGEFYKHNVLIWMHEATRVVRFARELPFVSDIILGGHSQGGLTTVLAGGAMSDCISALLPMSPAMNIKYGTLKGELLGKSFSMESLPEEIELSGGQRLSSDYLRMAMILPVEENVRKFRKPVCIIHGTADDSVPFSYGEALTRQYENAVLIPIEGADHCYIGKLDPVKKAVKEFLLSQRKDS